MSASPWALVIGASSGIGRSLALEYAARGYSVVLVARRHDELQHVAAEVRAANAEALVLASQTLTGNRNN